MQTLLAFSFVLGVLVFVHELGHFLLARWHGVRVLTFSLGFGPKLLSFKRGDTEYCLSAIPLGGYVKMAGENPEDQPQGAADEFLSKSKWQRFQILLAGPAMNMILAVLLLAVVLSQGDRVLAFLSRPAVIGVVQADSAAERGGMQPGDQVIRINGRDVSTWEDLEIAVTSRAEREAEFVVRRGGEERTLTIRPTTTKVPVQSDTTFEVGTIGVLPDTYPLIDAVNPGDPAEQAGFQKGDVILAIEGKRMVYSRNVSDALKNRAGQPTVITVRRGDAELPITVTPVQRGANALIGITLGNETVTYTPGPLEALGLSVKRNVATAGLILTTLAELLTGDASPRQLMGPVGIAQLSGASAREGWVELFALMASISLNLGLLNLLPIPVLDGGHMAIMGMEAVARRDFSLAAKERMLFAGFVLLMALMVTVIYNDLTRVAWIERLMPWRNWSIPEQRLAASGSRLDWTAMLIPRFWARAEGTVAGRDGQRLALRLWGWSQESVAEALALAKRRLAALSTRLSSATPGDPYLYGSRQPLREEIIRYLGADGRGQSVVTRNRYGALVLNTAQVPFIDVDAVAPAGWQGLRQLFGRAPAANPVLERIRDACGRHPRQAFRVYRTHSGYRVLATNTYLDPASEETTTFLNGFGADPAFVTLCRLQGSFRARLTPKPWRCGVPAPPGQHPRDPDGQAEFSAWLLKYETASRGYATCSFVEAIGSAPPDTDVRAIVDEHDRVTRATEKLPLA